MLFRIPATLAIAVLLLTACGSDGDDVPGDQPVKPASSVPTGWKTTDLDAVTVATPPDWTKQETQALTKTVDSTTWRGTVDAEGNSAAGAEVRVISKPQQSARRAARSLAINATAKLQGGAIEPVRITWPGATSAYYLTYEAKVGKPGEEKAYGTRTVVFDLKDGRQVQVTALAGSGPDAKLPAQVIGTVRLAPGS